MSSDLNFVEYVCEQIKGTGSVRYRKMFGDYMVYVNDKPLVLVCDNTAYVKELPCIADKMANAEKGFPYTGAKEHYILDVDDAGLCEEVISILEPVTPLPKKRKRK